MLKKYEYILPLDTGRFLANSKRKFVAHYIDSPGLRPEVLSGHALMIEIAGVAKHCKTIGIRRHCKASVLWRPRAVRRLTAADFNTERGVGEPFWII